MREFSMSERDGRECDRRECKRERRNRKRARVQMARRLSVSAGVPMRVAKDAIALARKDYMGRTGLRMSRTGFFGTIESLCFPEGEPNPPYTLQYVNLGEAYKDTLLRDGEGEVWVGSWGDWLEETETKYAIETGMHKCSCCGEWAEGFEPSETYCEDCEREGLFARME